ncbi:MCP four helix bundle domain-containing protein [Puniceicoccus vermicola]|uniref:DUF2780 domain-containing protein n=1 Tax=Puniceicoccus vermicola TaxID=388746 RepID=A0A7X1AV25_9BACT|nr:hypothetical protein [Puniceicoccus vermicola]MBC2600550.1 hypothetical protein [Puniceicoccus vermicola]
MKTFTILFSFLLTSLAFLGCTEEKGSDDSAASAKEEKSGGLLSSITEKGKSLIGGDVSMDDAMSQISKISGFSDTLNSTWKSVKGLDFSDKDALIKQVKSLASTASKNIGMLKQISPMVTGDTGKALIKQISGLSDQLGGLDNIIDKASSITSGDWGSYKDQIGSAIKGLSGGFSSLSKLTK